MIRLNDTDIINYELRTDEDYLIHLLPPECIGEIFSNLSSFEFQSTASVSRLFGKRFFDIAKTIEFESLKGFAKILDEYLENLNRAEKHSPILKSSDFLNAVNLKQAKASLYGLSENILNTLKDLNDEDLQNLEKLSKEKIDYEPAVSLFKSAKIYKRIDLVAKLDSKDFTKTTKIINLFKELLFIDNIDKAIEITALIPSESHTKSILLEDISQYLVEGGNLPKALVVVNMHEVSWMSRSFIKICKLLLENGRVNEAINETIQFVKTWPERKYLTFSDFLNLLIENKFISEAIEFFNNLEKKFKFMLLEELLKLLIKNNNSDKVVEIVKTLHSDYPDACDLSVIALLLINSGHDAMSFEIVNIASDHYQRAFILKMMSKLLLNEEDIDKSIEVANLIDEEFTLMKINALRDIWTFLENSGNDAKATEVENMIYGLQYLSFCTIQ